jgi:hypothetical protein
MEGETMTLYEKAVMLAGQFLTVLIHDSEVKRGVVELRADGVYINPSDAR